MSRDFDVEYEISNCIHTVASTDPKLFVNAIREAGYLYGSQEPETDFVDEKLLIRGCACLSGGETELEAHTAITQIVQKIDSQVTVATRWHFMTGWEWDDEYDQDDLPEQTSAPVE
jgi:hypothetical protein